MSLRYRLYPTEQQEQGLRKHCRDARYIWNIALAQCELARNVGQYADQKAWSRQLTEARNELAWLGDGSSMVQQQALMDLRQAFKNWWSNPSHYGHPTWRKAGRNEGFRIVQLKWEKLSRRWGAVRVPKVGLVKFRISRSVPVDTKSARVKLDRSGRWHISFVATPDKTEGPGDGSIVGIDRGIVSSYQSSDGRAWQIPSLSMYERRRLQLLQRKMARQKKESNRRERTRLAIARLKARETARRKDAIEKLTTELARTADIVRIENLSVKVMMKSAKGTTEHPGKNVAQKRGLNRSISEQGWTLFATRLEDKIGDRLERIPAAYTSQRCHACGYTASENRENQAEFRCVSCEYTDNADVNAAKNIAAGHAVSGRGRTAQLRPPVEASTTENNFGIHSALAGGGCQQLETI